METGLEVSEGAGHTQRLKNAEWEADEIARGSRSSVKLGSESSELI